MAKEPKEQSRREDPMMSAVASLATRLGVLEGRLEELGRTVAQLSAQLAEWEERRRGPGIEQAGYLAGQWHKRDGTVYAGVGLPGSPNANDPARPVPPPVVSGGRYKRAR